MQKIIFNGLLEVEDKIKVVVPHVTIYGGEHYNGEDMSCSREVFDAVLKEAGYYYNFYSDCFYLLGAEYEDTESNPKVLGGNVEEDDGVIDFVGVPLQYINMRDKNDQKIFTGDFVRFDNEFEGVVRYEPTLAGFLVGKIGLYPKDKVLYGGAVIVDEAGVKLENVTTFGNAIVYANQVCSGCGRKRSFCVCSDKK